MFLTNEHDFVLNNTVVKIVFPIDWQGKEIECQYASRKTWNLLIISRLLNECNSS